MKEQPGAYSEARNRIREKEQQEQKQLDTIVEYFEKQKETMRVGKKFDIFELRRKIETGKSLSGLKEDIEAALQSGNISRETFDQMQASLERRIQGETQKTKETLPAMIAPEDLPFSSSDLARFLEKKRLGENIWADIVWFLYGFFVQGSTLMIILAWKILIDLLFLPKDIYDEIVK